MKDYYHILQVPRDASASEIRDAYRRCARSTHPDLLGSENPTAFLEVQEAWEALGNPQSRRQYDQKLSRRAEPMRQRGEPIRPNRSFTSHASAVVSGPSTHPFDDLFSQLWSAVGGGGVFGPARSLDVDLVLDPEEAERGGTYSLAVPLAIRCQCCGGSGRQFVHFCRGCNGRGVERRLVNVPLQVPAGLTRGGRVVRPEIAG
jgi:molecular chaperone DnaJ